MGMGPNIFGRMFNRNRDENPYSQVQYQSVTPSVYVPEEYTQQVSQLSPQYMPAQFEFNPYSQAYLSQLSQPQQFQQSLSPNLASGLAALAEAYGIANPLAPAADSAPAPTVASE